jgi:hypothetical protein
MTRFYPLLAGAAFIVTLAGCASSPPVHYHTLSAAAVAGSAGQPASFAFELLPVGIPAQLDQERVVVRENATGMVIRDSERWTGPFGDEVRNALAVQLAASLHAQDVSGLDKTAGQQVMRVQVQVRRFDAWVGDKVQIEATWRLGFADADPQARLVCSSRFEAPAQGGYPELVQAQQRVLAQLAAGIAAGARAWDRSAGGACPGA